MSNGTFSLDPRAKSNANPHADPNPNADPNSDPNTNPYRSHLLDHIRDDVGERGVGSADQDVQKEGDGASGQFLRGR